MRYEAHVSWLPYFLPLFNSSLTVAAADCAASLITVAASPALFFTVSAAFFAPSSASEKWQTACHESKNCIIHDVFSIWEQFQCNIYTYSLLRPTFVNIFLIKDWIKLCNVTKISDLLL